MTVKGKVVRLETFGAFVEIGAERPGLIHISELAHSYVRTPGEVVREGDEIEAKVLEVNRRKKQIKLSIKALQVLPENLQMPEPPASKKQQEEEEPKEPDLTAMEIALRSAMEKSEGSQKESAAKKSRKKQGSTSEQDEILSRTLENKVGEES
jgi:predicted RNA-binding protein with RPS1 domain